MKCEKFGAQDCGTEDYDGCEVSDDCGELAERVSQGKAKILDSSIMNKIKVQDEELFGVQTSTGSAIK